MTEIIDAAFNYGVGFIIVALFLWDWVANRRTITETLTVIKEHSKNISDCLESIEQNNENMAKSLDILQKSVEDNSHKIDKLLER